MGPKSSSHMVTYFGSFARIRVGRMNHPLLSSYCPPAMISASWLARASSMKPESFLNARSSMTAPMKFVKSVGSPMVRPSVWATRSSFTTAQRLSGM